MESSENTNLEPAQFTSGEGLLNQERANFFQRVYKRVVEACDSAKMLGHYVWEDVRDASPAKKALFLGSAVIVGAHLAFADVAYANIALDVFKASGENQFLAGAAVAGASVAIETTSTLAVSNALGGNFPHTTKYLSEKYKPKKDNTGDASFALAFGSPGYIVKKYKDSPENTTKDNIRTGFKAVRGLAVFDFLLASALLTTTKYAQDINHTVYRIVNGFTKPEVAGIVPSIGIYPLVKSPVFWGGVFLLTRAKGLFSKDNPIALIRNENIGLDNVQ